MKNPLLLSARRVVVLAALSSYAALLSAEAIKPAGTIVLFNGRDLTGWFQVAQPTQDGALPATATWKVADGLIQCTGKPNGYIRTAARYRDYRLTVEWRWMPGPQPLRPDGTPRNRNNGVLLHMDPPDGVWPRSLEAQLMETNAGDFYVIGGVETAEHARLVAQAVAAAGTDEKALAAARNDRRTPKTKPSSEKPLGEWNTYDIVCSGDTVVVSVNGVEQNRATGVTVREGHICLQSEGAPIEFRHVRLAPLK